MQGPIDDVLLVDDSDIVEGMQAWSCNLPGLWVSLRSVHIAMNLQGNPARRYCVGAISRQRNLPSFLIAE